MLHQLAALFHTPLYSHLLHLFICLALHQLTVKRFGQIAMEGFGHYGQLILTRQRLDAGDDGNFNTQSAGTFHKGKIFLIVIE